MHKRNSKNNNLQSSTSSSSRRTTDGIERQSRNSHNGISYDTAFSGGTTVSRTEEAIKGKVDALNSTLTSFWHSMKYGWNIRNSNFNKESAIWFLGRCYHNKITPIPSIETSTTELTDLMTRSFNVVNDDRMHEEKPTSSELYLDSPTAVSLNGMENGVEPPEETGQDIVGNYEDDIDGFKKDFISRIWLTYRKDFEAMMQTEIQSGSNPQEYTTDCGWGCMIRSGQMMLAQALIVHFLGRSWRYDEKVPFSTAENHIHRKIIRWFGDQNSLNSPFSLHKIVELARVNGKKIGEWYGPAAVAHLLKDAVRDASKVNLDLSSLHVYVSNDCTIYSQDIFDNCYSVEQQTTTADVPWKTNLPQKPLSTWKSLILLIPLRLGNEKLNPIYSDCLKAMLSLEWCIGIIGGRPKHSLYFVGYQDDKLIHLDPHYCQDMVDVNTESFPLSSFHCKSPRKMKIHKMDPSCCLGFLISSRQDYDRFEQNIQQYLVPVQNFMKRERQLQTGRKFLFNYPMFVFDAGRLSDKRMEERISSNSYNLNSNTDDEDDDDDGIEDFVII